MLTPDESKAIEAWCERYKGHLSIEQLAVGINACVDNAKLLHDDGLVLLGAGRLTQQASPQYRRWMH